METLSYVQLMERCLQAEKTSEVRKQGLIRAHKMYQREKHRADVLKEYIDHMEAKCAALAEKGMEVVREASLVYSKYNDTQMPDRDIVDQQTLHELWEICAAQLRQDANTAELLAAGIITKVGE